jgi:NAD(P)-dependent dehydrogenase (short-subunit alcohol dehydrogenase family)
MSSAGDAGGPQVGPRAGAPSRTALVTGAARGIGREIALGLARHGLAVGMLGRSAHTLDETAEQCRDLGARVAVATADVRHTAAVTQAVASLEQALGTFDLLVNNAGRMDRVETGFADAPLDDVLGVLDVNLLGVLRVTHAVLASMRDAGHGRIVNVNSGFAFRRSAVNTGYGVSKAALARFTDLLAHQVADDGLVVLDVSPGLVRTDMTRSMPMWSSRDEVPWGDPADMVRLVVAVADGRLDRVSGRFVHAGADDLDVLADRVAPDRDLRTSGLRTYGPDDPLGPQ